MFHIDVNGRTAIYEQVEKNILKYIALGILEPGQQLPSVRSMAQDLGINPNTVQKAYGSLESKGVIFTVVGKGAFVADSKETALSMMQLSKDKLKKAAENAREAGVALEEQIEVIKKVYEVTK